MTIAAVGMLSGILIPLCCLDSKRSATFKNYSGTFTHPLLSMKPKFLDLELSHATSGQWEAMGETEHVHIIRSGQIIAMRSDDGLTRLAGVMNAQDGLFKGIMTQSDRGGGRFMLTPIKSYKECTLEKVAHAKKLIVTTAVATIPYLQVLLVSFLGVLAGVVLGRLAMNTRPVISRLLAQASECRGSWAQKKQQLKKQYSMKHSFEPARCSKAEDEDSNDEASTISGSECCDTGSDVDKAKMSEDTATSESEAGADAGDESEAGADETLTSPEAFCIKRQPQFKVCTSPPQGTVIPEPELERLPTPKLVLCHWGGSPTWIRPPPGLEDVR